MLNQNGQQIILEWKFTPPDYFEEPYVIKKQGYKIEIDNGAITATISPAFYEMRPDARMEFHKKINDLFLGAQVINFKRFSISKPTMHRLYPDGRKDISIFPDPLVCKCTLSDSVDITMTDKNGNIVADTKSKRINSRKN